MSVTYFYLNCMLQLHTHFEPRGVAQLWWLDLEEMCDIFEICQVPGFFFLAGSLSPSIDREEDMYPSCLDAEGPSLS